MPKVRKLPSTLEEATINYHKNTIKKSGNEYVDKISDEIFMQLYRLVELEFGAAAFDRKEVLTQDNKKNILDVIVRLYGEKGREFAINYLYDELSYYKNNGLREKYNN